jgi:hypothetical protein
MFRNGFSLGTAALGLSLLTSSCTSSSPGSSGDAGVAGGFVTGAADTHCRADGGAVIKQETAAAGCTFKPDGGGDAMAEYGATLFGSEGDDDDCKYHLKVTPVAVYPRTDTTFEVRVTTTVDGAAAKGAKTSAEVFLSDTVAGKTDAMKTVETSDGVYKVGPVQFTRSGRWTLRFHLHEDCLDYAEDSPHGHAAFYVDVP